MLSCQCRIHLHILGNITHGEELDSLDIYLPVYIQSTIFTTRFIHQCPHLTYGVHSNDPWAFTFVDITSDQLKEGLTLQR